MENFQPEENKKIHIVFVKGFTVIMLNTKCAGHSIKKTKKYFKQCR